MFLSPNMLQQHVSNHNAWQDLDLLNGNQSLIRTGKFLRKPGTGFELSGWTEIFALLFNKYRMFNVQTVFSSCAH